MITFDLYINSIGQRKKRGGGESSDNQSVATEAKKRRKAHIFPLPPPHISLFSVIPLFSTFLQQRQLKLEPEFILFLFSL